LSLFLQSHPSTVIVPASQHPSLWVILIGDLNTKKNNQNFISICISTCLDIKKMIAKIWMKIAYTTENVVFYMTELSEI
jgi:hypothetical protein